mgnify:CR=1 FL=1
MSTDRGKQMNETDTPKQKAYKYTHQIHERVYKIYITMYFTFMQGKCERSNEFSAV